MLGCRKEEDEMEGEEEEKEDRERMSVGRKRIEQSRWMLMTSSRGEKEKREAYGIGFVRVIIFFNN